VSTPPSQAQHSRHLQDYDALPQHFVNVGANSPAEAGKAVSVDHARASLGSDRDAVLLREHPPAPGTGGFALSASCCPGQAGGTLPLPRALPSATLPTVPAVIPPELLPRQRGRLPGSHGSQLFHSFAWMYPAKVTGWSWQGRKQPTSLRPARGGKFYRHPKGPPKPCPRKEAATVSSATGRPCPLPVPPCPSSPHPCGAVTSSFLGGDFLLCFVQRHFLTTLFSSFSLLDSPESGSSPRLYQSSNSRGKPAELFRSKTGPYREGR